MIRGSPWTGPSRAIETRYGRALRNVARQIGALINGFPSPVDEPQQADAIGRALGTYSEILGPWAEQVAGKMLREADAGDFTAWMRHSRTMGRALRQEIANAPTGAALRGFLDENVGLIKSMPTEAAQRVHRLTTEALSSGVRAKEIAKEIARSGEVTISRANLIARTEVARTASGFTQVRAQHIGSPGYTWETDEDEDVRPSHARMQGKFVAWSAPPTLDKMTGHAGCFPNCRCFPAPLLPADEDF